MSSGLRHSIAVVLALLGNGALLLALGALLTRGRGQAEQLVLRPELIPVEPPPAAAQPPPPGPDAAAASHLPALPALDLPLPSLAPSALALPELRSPVAVPRLALELPAVAAVDTALPAPPSAQLQAVWYPPLDAFYPRRARRLGITGHSRLRLTVDPDGTVIAAEVLASQPPGVFDSAAPAAARQIRFPADPERSGPVQVVKDIAWDLR